MCLRSVFLAAAVVSAIAAPAIASPDYRQSDAEIERSRSAGKIPGVAVAVVENGQIVIRPTNYSAMSYDHRIIDGREAVSGSVAMKDASEDPARSSSDS
ncbi:hypothetical protein OY671_012130 [Metschnikowia pulcherrima]|nr:hypothetical protein OY671_012130 [Metschnikowia pulcherrima]